MDQANLFENMVQFCYKSRSKTNDSKYRKQNTFDSLNAL